MIEATDFEEMVTVGRPDTLEPGISISTLARIRDELDAYQDGDLMMPRIVLDGLAVFGIHLPKRARGILIAYADVQNQISGDRWTSRGILAQACLAAENSVPYDSTGKSMNPIVLGSQKIGANMAEFHVAQWNGCSKAGEVNHRSFMAPRSSEERVYWDVRPHIQITGDGMTYFTPLVTD